MPISQRNFIKYTIFSLVIVLLSLIVLFLVFPKYFLGSLVSYKQESLVIPNIDYINLEEIIAKNLLNKASKIEYSGSGYYNIIQNDNIPYQMLDDIRAEGILLKNKVSKIDLRNPSYVLLYLGDTQNSFGFRKNGWENTKIGALLGGGKVHSVISDKWIFIEDCRRDNCPELDK